MQHRRPDQINDQAITTNHPSANQSVHNGQYRGQDKRQDSLSLRISHTPVGRQFRRSVRNAQPYSSNYHHHQHQVIGAAVSSERLEPFFDTSTQRNVTTSAGRTVYLPCRVHSLGDRTVRNRLREYDFQNNYPFFDSKYSR